MKEDQPEDVIRESSALQYISIPKQVKDLLKVVVRLYFVAEKLIWIKEATVGGFYGSVH